MESRLNINWKRCGRKRLWPILRNDPEICQERLMNTMTNPSQYFRSLGSDSNPVTIKTQRSVCIHDVLDRIFLNCLFNDAVSIDDGMINECWAVGGIKLLKILQDYVNRENYITRCLEVCSLHFVFLM